MLSWMLPRPAEPDELATAFRFDLDRTLLHLLEVGVAPTMSAEELMELTRGRNDEDPPASPSPLICQKSRRSLLAIASLE